ncbi:TRPM8 channel-associated factor homolog [Spea bombifrons]|uniref:TRPM8 channel-associated factor homolog n=1 Tax=Spea bombifrons TaxID=233779 RepID=UPI00234A1021|nr:TRPM8 channel-associated factor homolog [Spea bombifrons]XP_053319224.1 TRPM8 channel-associated factor homolog [Spea bombifrons]
MAFNEDYRSLVRGIACLDFTGNCVPCKLLLNGDSAFPILVTPAEDVLIAASRYGKGRLVVLAHESYLMNPQFTGFLQNAVSWLSPCPGAVIGVHNSLEPLAKNLSASGWNVQTTPGLTQGLGVLCTTGYDDNQAKEIISFLHEGGGLLIGAEAWHWANSYSSDNVLQMFPGNKIVSVSGIYFTGKYGEKGTFSVSESIPWSPLYTDVNFSQDLEHLCQGVPQLDISGSSVPSELLLHGPLAFPVGLSNSNQCFFAATYYGRGRVVVGTHEGYLAKPELKTFMLNAISWLGIGRKGIIGVHQDQASFAKILKQEGINCEISNLVPGLSVYCCESYSDTEAASIQRFVAEGGGLLIAGHAWYWSYGKSGQNVLTNYPGNKILNKFGISILEKTVPQGIYKTLDPEGAASCYHFPKAFCLLQKDLESGAEIKPPLSSWMQKLRQDASRFMKLPASPLISSQQEKFACLVRGSVIPCVSKECPVTSNSKEALILCLAQDVCCLNLEDKQTLDDLSFQHQPSVTVHIDATNPGEDAWRSTGLYLPPGKTAVIMFPTSAVGQGLQVQVGCQTDDLSSADKFCRAPMVVNKMCVLGEKIKISCVWGGLLYIIVNAKIKLGMIPVTVYGAEPAATYIKGKTNLTCWRENIRNLRPPWAELIAENIILTVPSESIRALDDPESLLSLWDTFMEAITELAATPKKCLRPERIVTDVQISAGWMHAGYPIMCHMESAKALTDLESIKKSGLWGPIHELGHNQQRGYWEFPPHTTEATCNLWSVYVHETVLGIPRDQAHNSLQPNNRDERIKAYLKNGTILDEWSVWTALETYLQLQEGFGWDPFKRVFSEYQTFSNVSKDKNEKMNLWVETFSRAVNRNLVPFFQAWGWPIEDKTRNKLSSLIEWENDPMKTYTAGIKA